jgi:hypothetical protein
MLTSIILEGHSGWTNQLTQLAPGAHVAVLTTDPEVAIEGRCKGLELRDTIAILCPGPRTTFAMLFRNPAGEATIADQVALTGTGAINVDGCRVAADLSEFFSATGKPRSGAGHAKGYGMEGVFGGDAANPPNEAGRWPPNLVIVHGVGCRNVGTQRIKGNRTDTRPEGDGGRADKSQWRFRPTEATKRGYSGDDGMETVSMWECASDCPVPFLDAISGSSTSRAGQPRGSAVPGQGWGMTKTGAEYNDSGGASRFYRQFANREELLAWINRLISLPPPERLGAPP